MFTSKQHLSTNLGVDPVIAAFFVDRPVPMNNRYWKDRYLYVAGGTGYLFIPLFFDLMYKCGVVKDKLLDEQFVQLMESILDSAAKYEFEEISYTCHLENCRQVMSGKIGNKPLYDSLTFYFQDENLKPYKNLGTFSKALNRADTFLFILSYLCLPQPLTEAVIESWYALVPSFLLMDDLTDLDEDMKRNEENAIGDFAAGKAGVEMAIAFLHNKFKLLKTRNRKLSEHFERSLSNKVQTPYVQSLIKE